MGIQLSFNRSSINIDMKNEYMQFLHAKTWSGRSWLLMLCFLLSIVIIGYVASHNIWKGKQYVQLDKQQILILNKYLNNDPGKSTRTDSILLYRQQRDAYLIAFLKSEMHQQLDQKEFAQTMDLVGKMNHESVIDYLAEKKFLVHSIFWLTGNKTYIEALLWSLMGVLVSLIYYVSIANTKSLHTAGTDDSGSFDPAEISGQVAKMFYAPTCTIVLILGYQYLIDANNSMIDISVNNGLIVFSFISGFFSGRVMRFLDRLKELILPFGTSSQPTATHSNHFGEVEVMVDLSESVSKSEYGASIAEAGFNAANVSLTPKNGGDTIALINPVDDQADTFFGKDIPYGIYTLQAQLSFQSEDDSIINLSASKEIEIRNKQEKIQLLLEKFVEEG